MERFSIWADWILGEPVTDELLLRVNTTWRGDDETFCSGAGNDDVTVLTLSFDVEAPNFDAAAMSARVAIEKLARTLDLRGRLLPLKGYTETHQYTED